MLEVFQLKYARDTVTVMLHIPSSLNNESAIAHLEGAGIGSRATRTSETVRSETLNVTTVDAPASRVTRSNSKSWELGRCMRGVTKQNK